jgi:signal transduction histidine kinase
MSGWTPLHGSPIRDLTESWWAAHESTGNALGGRSALTGVMRAISEAVTAYLAGGSLANGRCAAEVNLALYSCDEAVAEFASLRDHLVAALAADGPHAHTVRLWRFFEAEILALMRRAADADADPGADRPSMDTEVLLGDHGAAIADAYPFEGPAQRRRELYEERAVMLAEASKALSRSIRYDDTLVEIARIALRALADWVIVDALDAGGQMRRVVRHCDAARAPVAAELERDYVPSPASRGVPAHVLRTREPLLIPRVTDAHYQSTTRSPRHEELLRAMGSHSYMAVPMVVRGAVLGAVTLVSSDPQRTYGEDDVLFAEEICSRAAAALENSILYQRTVKAVQLRDEFLGAVSHDLRSPLQAIDMAAQSLEHTPSAALSEARAARLVGTIRSSSRRMQRLINDLLDLAKLEAGRLKLVPTSEPIGALIQELVQSFDPIAASKSVHLEWSADESVSAAFDRDRIFQALANLVGNAVKFTPPGGRVTVAATASGDEVRVAITDTGPGISPQDLPRLFDRYWQAREGTRSGTGLGLSIARAMVDAHGGRIEVASRLGHGSCFTVCLPITPHRQEGPPHAAEPDDLTWHASAAGQ